MATRTARRGTFVARCATAGRSTTRSTIRASGAIYAGGGSNWYGPAVWRSDDLGETWSHSSEGITYGDDAEKVATIWSLASGPGGAMYAGVEPAGLFRSDDGGATWSHVEGLTNHPSRPEWQAGNGGLILHSIVPSADDAERVWVGISSVGAFETAGRRRLVGDAKRGRARRLHARGPAVPGLRPMRAQARHGRRRRRAPVPAEPLRRVPLIRRRQPVGGDHRRPADRVRLPDGRAPARPEDGLDHPAHRAPGRSPHARRPRRRLAHA